MNKTDLVKNIAEKSGLNKKDSEKALNALVSTIEDTLSSGDKVNLIGFVSFEVRERAERLGRNPQTKDVIIIPAVKAPVFKAGKGLKDIVNK